MKPLRDCKYSLFISYAHADDQQSWITNFEKELCIALRCSEPALRGIPGAHLSQRNGPVAGDLAEELEQRIADSFAMIVVVGQNYAESVWCEEELQLFLRAFGNEGMRQRLYIVAISKPAMDFVKTSTAWEAAGAADNVWNPFFRKEDPKRPLRIYGEKEYFAASFEEMLNRLVDDLSRKIKNDLKSRRGPFSQPHEAETSGDKAPQPFSGKATPLARNVLFGVTTAELPAAVSPLIEAIRRAGLSADTLDSNEMIGGFPAFDKADILVLPFSNVQPLLSSFPGGHLAFQHDAWVRRGKLESNIIWLDMRAGSSDTKPLSELAGVLKPYITKSIKPSALPERLGLNSRNSHSDGVRIYIESNNNEVTLWEPLGDQIAKKWDEIVGHLKPELQPPLYIRKRGLPIDQIDEHPNLNDADGVVLLWGRKTPEALVSQIDKVEGKLSGRDLAPGIVAYLMPPQKNPEQPVPAWGWKVLRFNAESEQDIDVVKEEAADLKEFLRKIFLHTAKRRGMPNGPQVAATLS